ncbi:dicarboxylate/amino acid:cation symporter [Paraclostridium sordellii]|uniref:dicarboxylate/amino acid:cation symporter n=1 Tax=Paraclostridium sordellii TaxID=1505 RepID=UPI000543F9E1|nr:dicarboxylate/amino acid:cation symporter [Paeniclostridium sordellii]MBS6025176.1 dicarboxylate/amino acid:cation symporter [Paeniclostridium sordellii]MDU6113918.1 dicarboxylate/amino acid:cation symporter [Paeniclostridium sordellii]MRZ79051.1 cation:dicarboxylase symporter family transporter [Paeniclostridium sordellii]MSB59013.1 cation:dicarboxylase symporter family transporter [Paeniclostridium sordellii]RGX02027.1 dicarboxylate/amino acid:cation symporter [Paeniclostridium sordellii]
MKKKNIGLIPKLIMAIIIGIVIGTYMPRELVQILVTASSLFSTFLKFVIPFIILGFVTAGIADLSSGAGKLLGATTIISYVSTVIAGLLAFTLIKTLFPFFMDPSLASKIGDPEAGMLPAIFSIPLKPMIDVTAAIVFAFMMGLGISALRKNNKGEVLYKIAFDFQSIIQMVLAKAIIPLLPLYIAGTFANIAFAGQVMNILSVFWKVYIVVMSLHLIYVALQFTVAGMYAKKNPIEMMKNQIPAYLTAVGTQSSAAAIPVNVDCAEKNGISKQIREFVIPLCATIHLSGSIISIVSFSVAVLMMNGMDSGINIVLPYIMMLGIAMVAAPGAPGGAVMSALPFFPMVGIPADGGLASLIIALHITQDSFGTAANISGDNAIAVAVDALNNKWRKKENKRKSEKIA